MSLVLALFVGMTPLLGAAEPPELEAQLLFERELFNGREIDVTNLPLEMRPDEAAVRHGAFELPESGVRLDEIEVSLIAQALSRTAGNRSRAARLLGISRDTLLYRMRKYALD